MLKLIKDKVGIFTLDDMHNDKNPVKSRCKIKTVSDCDVKLHQSAEKKANVIQP